MPTSAVPTAISPAAAPPRRRAAAPPRRRADALRAAGVGVDWRVVEHERSLPVAGRRLSPAERDGLSARFAGLTGLLLPGERLPWAMPTIVPKTEASASAYAESYGAGVGDDVRRLLFTLYWLEGADIGSPAVLRTPVRFCAAARMPIHCASPATR